MQPGRSFQGLRIVSRSCDARANDPDRWSGCNFRYGRSEHTADVAIHSTLCQENSRLVTGRCTTENQKYSHHKPALRVQRRLLALQAIPQAKTKEPSECSVLENKKSFPHD